MSPSYKFGSSTPMFSFELSCESKGIIRVIEEFAKCQIWSKYQIPKVLVVPNLVIGSKSESKVYRSYNSVKRVLSIIIKHYTPLRSLGSYFLPTFGIASKRYTKKHEQDKELHLGCLLKGFVLDHYVVSVFKRESDTSAVRHLGS
jgi:hypothetical protein